MGATHFNAVLTTSDQALVSPGSDVILGLLVAINGTGSPVTVNLSVHRQSGQVETLANGVAIPANSAQEVVNTVQMALSGVLLRSGDSLHGSASAGSAITLLAAE